MRPKMNEYCHPRFAEASKAVMCLYTRTVVPVIVTTCDLLLVMQA